MIARHAFRHPRPLHIILSCLILIVISIAAVTLEPHFSQRANALSGSDFNAGYIIDDSVFYNQNAMTPSAIQSFLNSQVTSCDTQGTQPATEYGRSDLTHAQYAATKNWQSPPYICLKDYSQNTPQMGADSGYCDAIPAGTSVSSAQIIYNVAQACHINPEVLIVLLQKEQSLVMDTWPLNSQYSDATGFACPTGAPCDPSYGGFFYQVFYAARQFQIYKALPNNYNYIAGRNNNIYYNPDLTHCGSSTVYIQNQATAALYNYTPYQPNAAALANLYGNGDSCSSYGNRNFWRLFSDWFGTTRFTVIGGIQQEYNAAGGAPGLGYPLMNESCGLTQGGCYQVFQNGVIYWTPALGGHTLFGAILNKWVGVGKEWSSVGYPTTDEACNQSDGGCIQYFQNDIIYWTPNRGTFIISNPIYTQLQQLGGIKGYGYPSFDTQCGTKSSGCYQDFQKGTIYWSSATGAYGIYGGIQAKWTTTGKEWGTLGYPTSGQSCNSAISSCQQSFENGIIVWNPNNSYYILNGINTRYQQLGSVSSFGYPIFDTQCGTKYGGCYQTFSNGGTIYYSTVTGSHSVIGGIQAKWTTTGKEWGTLGYPTSNEYTSDGQTVQDFEHGHIYWTATKGAWITIT